MEQKHSLTKYTRAIANWTYLGTWLATNDVTFEDLGIFLRLELDGKRRDFIINRLAGRVHSMLRERINSELKQLLAPEEK